MDVSFGNGPPGYMVIVVGHIKTIIMYPVAHCWVQHRPLTRDVPLKDENPIYFCKSADFHLWKEDLYH